MKNLVIVESPTKARTISHFLGNDFLVISSYGHIRDLPKSKLGVDIEKNFQPIYVIPPKARKIIKELKEKKKESQKVILACDEDREGEAIAWHLAEVLNLQKPERIVFHEITKKAILEALKKPRAIDFNLVKAQQARRVLDRLVGYKLSPFLWHKITRGLSAGRVQSAALRLIVEREKEIKEFKPRDYWTIEALLEKEKKEFKAILFAKNGKKLEKFFLNTEKKAKEIVNLLKEKPFFVSQIEEKEITKNPLPPFKTSTLQQEAWRELRFSSKKTMLIAQHLYEGKNLAKGRQGLITYMRTDSLNISPLALKECQLFIDGNFGKNYSVEGGRKFKSKEKLTQEAHEAIRPTEINLTPEKIKNYLDKDEYKLYDLIWRRFVASQMKEAKIKKINLLFEVEAGKDKYLFKASGSRILFDGFLKIWPQKIDEFALPELKKGEEITPKEIIFSKHSTQPPSRYNDASLVKTLESYGIGRPSTYAPIISVLQERGYVKRDSKFNFYPNEIGILVSDILSKHFPEIVDYQFTAKMEDDLDKIAQGKLSYSDVLRSFWLPFAKNLAEKEKNLSKEELSIIKTEKKCPLCGSNLVIRFSKFGKFLACSNFPKCSYKENIKEEEFLEPKMKCPQCHEGWVVIKRTKKGKIFYGCSRYPQCQWASWQKPK